MIFRNILRKIVVAVVVAVGEVVLAVHNVQIQEVVENNNYLNKKGKNALFIMGRDLVELAKRAKYKPPVMRVHGECYTKNHLSAIIRLFKPIFSEKVFLMDNTANSLAYTKWMCRYHIVFTPKYRRKAIYNQYK